MGKPTPDRELTPPISISSDEQQRLNRLVSAYASVAPEVADYLARELERAKVLKKPDPGIVHVGSWVTFRDETTGRTRSVQLVYPDEANIAERRISVMTPIGVALVGMAIGKVITFYARDGAPRNLTVLTVADLKPAPLE